MAGSSTTGWASVPRQDRTGNYIPPAQWGKSIALAAMEQARLIDIAFVNHASESVSVWLQNPTGGAMWFRVVYGAGGTSRTVVAWPGRFTIACETLQVDAVSTMIAGAPFLVSAFAARTRATADL